MNEIKNNKTKIWDATLKKDLIVKSIPAILTVLAVVFGIIKLSLEFNHENKLEFSRNLYQNRLTAYEEIGEVVGHLMLNAEKDNDSLFTKYSSDFNILHLRLVPLIMDDDVDFVMSEFIQSIKDFENNYIQINEFNIQGYTVLKECQKSLRNCYKELVPKNEVQFDFETTNMNQLINDEN